MQANRNGHTKVFSSRGTRNVQCIVPNEREHLTILSAISASGVSIPNYYIFKGKRANKTYIQLYEDGATIGMSKKGWMDNHLFAQWMDHFLNSLTTRGFLTFTKTFANLGWPQKPHQLASFAKGNSTWVRHDFFTLSY